MLEKRLAKAAEEAPPVPLPERAPPVCELYAALAQCRFGAGKQGQNAYRAGLMGMLPPQKWAPYPEALITPAALDADAGRRSRRFIPRASARCPKAWRASSRWADA